MALKHLTIGRKIGLSFGILVAISAIMSVVSFMSMLTIKEQDAWTVHTYNVIDHGNLMMAAVIDQETGVRGYLVSGDENFLVTHMGLNGSCCRCLRGCIG